MNLSNNSLKAFHQLAQDLNFTKAAASLAITQSAFSQRILNLERELETTLVIREKGNIQLTDAGERLLRYCDQFSKLEEQFVHEIKDDDAADLVGTVRIASFSSIHRSCLIPSLGNLLRDNPRLEFFSHSAELDELTPLLRNSKVDFIIHNKLSTHNSIENLFLGYEDNVLVKSKKHDLSHIYLDHDPLDVTTSSYFKLKPELAKNIKKRYLDDVYGLIDGVKLGLGRAILPLHLIKDEKDLTVLYPRTKLRVPLYLQYYKNSYLTKIEKEVISAVMDFFQKEFAQK
jgi:DNA-binding transcriptional LysR family regulator